MCAAAAKTGRHMVADTPSSNTLSIIKRKEFQEDPYAGQSRYKHKLKRPSVCFFVLLPPSIFRLVLTPRRNVWLRDRWPTQSAHTAVFFFFVLSSPVMQQAGSVWESQPGRVGCGAKLFSLFPRLQMACPAADCLLYNIQ